MTKRLILVGGGHAHLVTLANLNQFRRRGHHVTVIAPSAYHYYSGMGPGMLSRIYRPDQIRFNIRQKVTSGGGVFIRAHATGIDPRTRTVFLDSGKTVDYDVLSLNSGSCVAPIDRNHDPRHPGHVYTVKPIASLLKLQARILSSIPSGRPSISVIGGGPAALEIAGNAWRLARDNGLQTPQITVFAGIGLMSHFSKKVRIHAVQSLQERKIGINENGYVKEIRGNRIILETGETHAGDIICLAHGVRPTPIFKATDLPLGPDGGLRVNRFLQSTAYSNIFGGGDCIYFEKEPLDKVGVYAVRQNKILYHNLLAALENKPLVPFSPGGDYLLAFNLGDGSGILQKKGVVLKGRSAFWLKDTIDRRFMKRFQC